MYSLTATVNLPESELEFDVKPDAVDTDTLEKAISEIISTNPKATSFVFVVARMPQPVSDNTRF